MQHCHVLYLIWRYSHQCLVVFCVSRQYNQYKTPMENIGLQDSLLSRFDLLFIVLDIVSYLLDICGNAGMCVTIVGSFYYFNDI